MEGGAVDGRADDGLRPVSARRRRRHGVVRRLAGGVPVPVRVLRTRPDRRPGAGLRRRGLPGRQREPAQRRSGAGVHPEERRPPFRAHAALSVHR